MSKFTDLYLKWGEIYEITSFNMPAEQIMYLGHTSNGYIICCSENELQTEWEDNLIAKRIPSSMAENFETINTMLDLGIINNSNIGPWVSSLWYLAEDSKENIILKWFHEKILSISDLKTPERGLPLYLNISKNMLKKDVKSDFSINVYMDYMEFSGRALIENSKQRLKAIREYHLSQLPF